MSSSFPGRFQNLQKLTAQCHLATRSVRQLSTTSSRPYPRKDAQDRESIDTNATEYSKSGSDDMAAHKDVAFEPGRTKPDEALDKAEKEVCLDRRPRLPMLATGVANQGDESTSQIVTSGHTKLDAEQQTSFGPSGFTWLRVQLSSFYR